MKFLSEKDPEYWKLKLEEFIGTYKPKNWTCEIHDVDFTPHFDREQFNQVCEGEFPTKECEKWYIRAAIQEWLEKHKNVLVKFPT